MNENKIYVRVVVEFDKDGFMYPRVIKWPDGHQYEIDRVMDVKHAHAEKAGGVGERFTVRVRGRERYLFYERTGEMMGNQTGRWFVERA